MSHRPFQLRAIVIGDEPAAWIAAGFTVTGATTRIANTEIRLVGPESGRGILSVEVDGIDNGIDGMPFTGPASDTVDAGHAERHENGVVDFDHLVAMSPDMDRTSAALNDAGLEHRRSRTFAADGGTRRQSFYWLGDVILEVVGDDDAHGDGAAVLWGLALTCDDLRAASRRLGDRIGSVKEAVQAGRQIATLRTREIDVSVPIALMSPHPSNDA